MNLSFNKWHEQKIVAEGPRSISPKVAGALKTTTEKLDAEMQAIEQQVKQLWSRHGELKAKKQRLIIGMGGGYGSNDLLQPNDFMKHYDQEVGRRPDIPPANGRGYPVDYGSTKQTRRRQQALQGAAQDRKDFTNPAAFDFYQKISRAEPGNYRVPKGVSPQDAEKIVKTLIGDNEDYEDFGIYHYDAGDNTIHVGDPADI